MHNRTNRTPEYPIIDLILHRWSARAMSGEPIADSALMSLFEAARWAPSCFNSQPWRFIYAKRDTPAWHTLFELLVDFNKQWCINAAVLVVIISKKLFDNGKPSRTHSFDAGAAWENLALQGMAQGLVVHAMEGFDYERAQQQLCIPPEYAVEVMVALGKPGAIEQLPAQLQERETLSDRKEVHEIVFEGIFRKSVL